MQAGLDMLSTRCTTLAAQMCSSPANDACAALLHNQTAIITLQNADTGLIQLHGHVTAVLNCMLLLRQRTNGRGDMSAAVCTQLLVLISPVNTFKLAGWLQLACTAAW
jgi:hypothetical protein